MCAISWIASGRRWLKRYLIPYETLFNRIGKRDMGFLLLSLLVKKKTKLNKNMTLLSMKNKNW